MKVKILSGTVVGGKRVKAGEVVECSERDARVLINFNKAEEVEEKKATRGRKKATSKE